MQSVPELSDEVAEALANGRPVVALESTIISHGMPYPQNRDTALQVEQRVRDSGATPATIAVINGAPVAGTTPEQIDRLATAEVIKASRRDLAMLCARGLTGATTVAATMIIAKRAGIRVFATGGIGGVHRDFSTTLDVSADLQELARTRIAVVCAGIKSILDLPRTLEYLETMGVPVLGYQTDELPAFYSRDSGLAVDYRVESPADIAKVLRAQDALGLDSGELITVPVSSESAIPFSQMEAVIAAALDDMQQAGVSGKDSTPFLLSRVAEKTQGESLATNMALIMNNAGVAGAIAAAYAE
ncbi:MAG: pseudouridine-5'-phosphate glycosidase [Pseudomonadota bacterium]